MKRTVSGLSLLLVLVTVWTVPAAASFKMSQWQHFSDVIPGDTAKGYALVELTGPLCELAEPDLRDLRVTKTGKDGLTEVPYDIVNPPEGSRERSLSAIVINRGTVGKDSTATVDMGSSRTLHNRLKINTANRNFIKEVTLEGSQDRQTWTKIRNSGKIADFTSTGRIFHQTEITYDSADFRYLRVSLTGGTGDVVDIAGIDVLFSEHRTETEKELPMRITGQQVSPKDNSSIITMTGGFSKFPVDKLRFSTQDVNFSRPAAVFGSSDMQSWEKMGEGSLANFNLANYTESRLTLPINPASYRYLRVIIQNGDSAPLKVTGIGGVYYPRYILFPCEAGGSYRVYVKNPLAQAPKYDLTSFSNRVMDSSPPVWGMTAPQKNPDFQQAVPVVPESEKHKWLLPGILALLVAGLTFFIARSLPKVMNDGK